MNTKPSRGDEPQQCTQVDRFRDLAREIECDEDEAAFEEKVRKVAGKPRKPEGRAKGD